MNIIKQFQKWGKNVLHLSRNEENESASCHFTAEIVAKIQYPALSPHEFLQAVCWYLCLQKPTQGVIASIDEIGLYDLYLKKNKEQLMTAYAYRPKTAANAYIIRLGNNEIMQVKNKDIIFKQTKNFIAPICPAFDGSHNQFYSFEGTNHRREGTVSFSKIWLSNKETSESEIVKEFNRPIDLYEINCELKIILLKNITERKKWFF